MLKKFLNAFALKEDFFFGKSILNDALTVFYNITDDELKNGNLKKLTFI